MEWTKELEAYVTAHEEEGRELLKTLCQIPAPSNHEKRRAEFCRDWLEAQGAEGVYIDEALNVIYPVGCEGDKPLAVFMAHTDVVFPDKNPLPMKEKDGRLYAPGVGDDTANLAALLIAAKYIAQSKREPEGRGILLAANSGEEGLGNLKGSRKICEDFGPRIEAFYTFDSSWDELINVAVGSRRYRVEVRTEGGHSYMDFGNRNAIVSLSSMIECLYDLKVPQKGKTTYNVGMISGGTSVNTIAQQAQMYYEYRSESRDDMEFMDNHLFGIVRAYQSKGIKVNAELVGERPCMGEVDPAKQRLMIDLASHWIENWYGSKPALVSGSTDCNIPLSMGIPSVCLGVCYGEGAHTRQEWVDLGSLMPGYRVALGLILSYFEKCLN